MTVTVERQADARVPEVLLDRLRVMALRDEERGAGVSEVVEPEAGIERRPVHGRFEVPSVEVPPSKCGAFRRGEHVALVAGEPPDMLPEHLRAEPGRTTVRLTPVLVGPTCSLPEGFGMPIRLMPPTGTHGSSHPRHLVA